MPSHQVRVAKNYDGLCEKCLHYPNREWDDESQWPSWCDLCVWKEYVKQRTVRNIPQSILDVCARYDRKVGRT